MQKNMKRISLYSVIAIIAIIIVNIWFRENGIVRFIVMLIGEYLLIHVCNMLTINARKRAYFNVNLTFAELVGSWRVFVISIIMLLPVLNIALAIYHSVPYICIIDDIELEIVIFCFCIVYLLDRIFMMKRNGILIHYANEVLISTKPLVLFGIFHLITYYAKFLL